MNVLGFNVYIFVPLIYLLLVGIRPPSLALLCDPGPGFYRPHFPWASDCRLGLPTENTALENTAVWKRKRGLSLFRCFVLLLGGKRVSMQGSGRRFLESRAGLWPDSRCSRLVYTAEV